MNTRARILASVFAALTVAGAAVAQQGRALPRVGPTIHKKYPPHTMTVGSLAEKDVDCGLLTKAIEYPDPKQYWVTCDFITSADNNSTPVCSNTHWIPLTEAGQRDLANRFMRAQANPTLEASLNRNVNGAPANSNNGSVDPNSERAAFDRAKEVARQRGSASMSERDVAAVIQADLSLAAVAALKHFGQLHHTCIDASANALRRERINGRQRTVDEVSGLLNKKPSDVDTANSAPNWIRYIGGKECVLEEIINECTAQRAPR